MPKRKVRNSASAMPKVVAALFRVRELHSPCISENCPIEFRHCTGCNESYPCRTMLAIEGTTQLRDTITVYGDQELTEGAEETVVSTSFEPSE